MRKTVIAFNGIITFFIAVFWMSVNMFANDGWIINTGKPILYCNIVVLLVELFVADYVFDLSFNKVIDNHCEGSPTVDMIVYGSVFLNFVLTLIWCIVRYMYYFSNSEYDTDIVRMKEFYIPIIALANHIFAVGHYAVFYYYHNSKAVKKRKHRHK